jgi:nitroreductase
MNALPVTTVVADPASVDAAIASRFSCRAFLRERPVPRALIESILDVASRAPSGTNTQPWRTYVLQGASLNGLVDKACSAHDALYADPAQAARYPKEWDYYPQKWVSPYIDRRRENGWGLYGLLGITKGEKDRMHAQHQRNFRFLFLQNSMVAARGHGLHTCPQAAWNGFASIVLPHIGAGADEMLVCGMALGYADEAQMVNGFHTPREPVAGFTRWRD